MSTPITLYATDEDIAVRAPSDFAALCPHDQVLASGTDGEFPAGDGWTLQANSVDFAAQGLAPGHVVQLLGPVSAFGTGGDLLVVDQVSAKSLRLRRKGQATGLGQPPAPLAGLTGVSFLVTTLAPQIESASYDLNRRYGIDDRVAGLRTSDLYDLRELREVTVLYVLYMFYVNLSQTESDPFGVKARLYRGMLDEALARLTLLRNAAVPSNLEPPVTPFGTRMSR